MRHKLQAGIQYEIKFLNSISSPSDRRQHRVLRDALTVELDMWTMKRSSQFAFVCLVLSFCTVLVYSSFRPKQTEEGKQRSYLVVRKFGFKRLHVDLQPPTCLKPNLENAEETYVVGFNKEGIQRVVSHDSVLQKDFRFPAGRYTSVIFLPVDFQQLP